MTTETELNGDARRACREAFKDSGLGYEDLGIGDIHALHYFLDREIKKFVKTSKSKDTITSMRMANKIVATKRGDGSIEGAYLYVNSSYFHHREAISFNPNGFIAFAGWASDNNVKPFASAFMAWLDFILMDL